MKIPFSYDSVENDIVGKKMVISRNQWGSTRFEMLLDVVLEEGGSAQGADEWSVENGLLRIEISQKDGFYDFRGVESRNGVIYAVGFHSVEDGSVYRVTMHERVPVGESFGICISSHVDYDDALQLMYKSLRKAGFKNPIKVVVSGCKEHEDGKVINVDGIEIIKRKVNAMGFTALGDVDETMDYWMLLHDTCSVDEDFIKKASNIDVGMKPDVVLFSNMDDKLELGLYLTGYMSNFELDLSGRSVGMLKAATDNASIVVDGISIPKFEGEQDVYGGGIMRKIMAMKSVGVRKYVGKRMHGGRP